MQLTQQQVIQLYESVVKPFLHPDPLGYMARSLLLSEFDPDYVDLEGNQGFLPVNTQRAMMMTGSESVAGLENNVITTLAMDRLLIEKHNGDINKAMIDFHFGEFAVPVDDQYTQEQQNFIDEINEGRLLVKEILFPRKATVADVIELLDQSEVDERLDSKTREFVKVLLEV